MCKDSFLNTCERVGTSRGRCGNIFMVWSFLEKLSVQRGRPAPAEWTTWIKKQLIFFIWGSSLRNIQWFCESIINAHIVKSSHVITTEDLALSNISDTSRGRAFGPVCVLLMSLLICSGIRFLCELCPLHGSLMKRDLSHAVTGYCSAAWWMDGLLDVKMNDTQRHARCYRANRERACLRKRIYMRAEMKTEIWEVSFRS